MSRPEHLSSYSTMILLIRANRQRFKSLKIHQIAQARAAIHRMIDRSFFRDDISYAQAFQLVDKLNYVKKTVSE
jgi:hypothetical protein